MHRLYETCVNPQMVRSFGETSRGNKLHFEAGSPLMFQPQSHTSILPSRIAISVWSASTMCASKRKVNILSEASTMCANARNHPISFFFVNSQYSETSCRFHHPYHMKEPEKQKTQTYGGLLCTRQPKVGTPQILFARKLG